MSTKQNSSPHGISKHFRNIRLVKEVSKLAPPEAAVKDGFEKPIAIASASPSRPVTGNGSLPTRPSSSRRPPSRAVRNNLTVIHQDSR